MDTDTEDDYALRGIRARDAIKKILEVANTRPGTNVAKAILAYQESPGISTLLLLLEEVSKNTDYSTDLRLSLSYYMDEFLRQVSGSHVPRRSVIASAGSVLQYCSKIYGDRVEFMYQIVEHQIEALLIADPAKDEAKTSAKDGNKDAITPEQPRKRRTKKLTQKEFDPFSYKMEPKKFKIMNDEKRFSRIGFETNKNRNRTIEHMYQDHTPAHLWKYAPIVDPHNPYEQDEKKNYKLFTYHPEPRYNTLLPDIQFDRLNLIKEYVHSNQVDVSDTLNRDRTNKEYLDEYIALENQMLASRHGEVSVLKRPQNAEEDVQAKRLRLELENLQKRFLERTDETSKRRRLSDGLEDNRDGNMDCDETTELPTQASVDSALGESFQTIEDTSDEALNDNSTLVTNDASCLNSTPLDQSQSAPEESSLELSTDKDGDNSNLQLQIDSGIGLDEICDTLPTAQSFDDEGVVLTDIIDEQRLMLLSPKVMVHDILPGVVDKANLTVRIDSEMLALSGITETIEETVHVQRTVHYSLKLNILQLPPKRVRKECLFRLPKEFELFKKARIPSKRQAEPKPSAVPRQLALASPLPFASSQYKVSALPLDQIEFDSELNFRGFRRPTYDSGIDQEEIRMAISPADDDIMIDVGIDELPELNGFDDSMVPDEIQQARFLAQIGNFDLPESPLDTTALDTTVNETEANDEEIAKAADMSALEPQADDPKAMNDTAESATADDANAQNDTEENVTAEDPTAQINTEENVTAEDPTAQNNTEESAAATTVLEQDSGLNDTSMDSAINEEQEPEWDEVESNTNIPENCSSIDEETDAKIIDWHRRLAPTLEASHARQNFSIQDLNDEIIAKCQEQNGAATLEDVIEDKDPTKLCCYMLSSLLLTNQGNVKLNIGTQDKSKPITLAQFKMKLISTERKQLNPEDDIGNMNNPSQPKTAAPLPMGAPETSKAVRRKREEQYTVQSVNVKTVRLIKPVPKASGRPEDADSGISSLPVSLVSAFSNYA